MTARTPGRRTALFGAGLALLLATAGCSSFDLGQGFSSTRTQGYEISESALQQIRPGQSVDLVVAVLGSPMTTNTFDDETVYYYVETKVQETAFGLDTVQDRTVLAVYFDDDNKVKDKAIYGLQDGRVIAIESRRTASFGQDRTFIEQILGSVGL